MKNKSKKGWTNQLVRVFNAVRDHRWHTLVGLSNKVSAPPQSVSARLRDLRKVRFGGYQIDRAPLRGNVYKYRLTP